MGSSVDPDSSLGRVAIHVVWEDAGADSSQADLNIESCPPGVDSVRVQVSGPTNRTTTLACAVGEADIEDVRPGSYLISLAGLNAAGEVCYSGSDSATVVAGQTANVEITLVAVPQPDITVSPSNLSFAVQAGQSSSQTLTVQNEGTATLTVSSITDNASWLSESPTSLTVGAGSSGNVTVTADASEVTPGSYGGTITITSNDPDEGSVTVGVTLVVGAIPQPDIDVSPASLSLTLQSGSSDSQTLTLQNVGTGALHVTSITDDVSWLSESPESLSLGADSSGTVNVMVETAGMDPGDYAATITILSNDPDEGTVTIPVALTVTAVSQPSIVISPTSLSFTVQSGSSGTQALMIGNDGTSTLHVTSISDDQLWLSESPTSFAVGVDSSQTVTVTANAAGMSTGAYSATITVASDDPDEATVTVGVTLNVTSTPQPDIEVSPATLSFSVQSGAAGSQNLTVQNTGYATLNVTSVGDDQPWLSESPNSCTVGAGSNQTVAVTVDAAGMDPGNYSATITILSDDPDEGSVTVPVALTVTTAPEPDIVVSPTNLVFTVQSEQISSQSLAVQNAGTATLNVTSISDDQLWLSESPTSFAVGAGLGQTVTVTVNASGMNVGSYGGTITVASDDPDEATVTVGVTLNVTSIPQPDIGVSPASLSFTVQSGQISSQTLAVGNSGNAALTVTSITDGQSWLSESPTNFSVPSGSSQNVSVTVNAAGLAAGVYSGTITVVSNDPDEGTVTVPVALTVTPVPQPDISVSPTSLVFTVQAGQSGSQTLTVQNAGTATLNVTSISDDQPWLSESPTSFQVGTGSSQAVTVTANAMGLAAGTYGGTVTIVSNDPDEGTVTVPVALTVTAGPLLEMIRILGGTFSMGSNVGADELPVHQVSISTFWMSKYEITQAQYSVVMGENPSGFVGEDRPVETVTWFDAAQFCNLLSAQEGHAPFYNQADLDAQASTVRMTWSANGYRLPTEAEWEYACRAGTSTDFYSGNMINNWCEPLDPNLDAIGWYCGNSGLLEGGGQTFDVGQKDPNVWGLYDMSGNVFEWCNDWYQEDYYGSSPSTDPHGPSTGCTERVERGGGWYFPAVYCRSSARARWVPNEGGINLGFRVSRPE